MVGVVRHLFPGEEASAPVFNLLVRSVASLAETPDSAAAASVVLAARLKLLALLGYAPEMSHCVACEGTGPLYGYSPGLGGAVCSGCAESMVVGCFALSEGAQATLCTLLGTPLAELEHLELDDRATAEVEQVITQTLAFHGH